MEFALSARPPFSLAAVIRSHGWVRLAPFGADLDAVRLTYVQRTPAGQVAELGIREADGGVRVRVSPPPTDPSGATQVASAVKWMLGLDQDLGAFYAMARPEPKLARAEERALGRILRCPTLFEDAVKTILTTNTTWSGTIRMVETLVARFGNPLPGDPARHAFPTPAQLATTDEATLRETVRLGYRAPYVLGLARAVAEERLDLEALKTADLPTVELRKRLLAIKGIGGYAAANLLMILGRYDFVPIDSWALKIVSHEWHGGQAIGPAEVEAAFARWGEWKGLAYWLWDWSHK